MSSHTCRRSQKAPLNPCTAKDLREAVSTAGAWLNPCPIPVRGSPDVAPGPVWAALVPQKEDTGGPMPGTPSQLPWEHQRTALPQTPVTQGKGDSEKEISPW